MNEVWRDIPRYEGIYQVSNLGNVRSLDRYVRAVSKAGREFQRRVAGVTLCTGDCRGYRIVNLHPTGTIAVHRLVAVAFVDGATPGLEVNHKDGNKANNAATNLEWVSRSRNQEHAIELGLKAQAIRVECPSSGTVYPSITKAARAAKCRASAISKGWTRV